MLAKNIYKENILQKRWQNFTKINKKGLLCLKSAKMTYFR